MSDTLHAIAAGTFAPMLGSLSNVLDKGAQHAVIQGWPATRLPDARLAPDMFNLTLQVQVCCFQVRDNLSLLADLPRPEFEGGDMTIEDMKSHIAATIAFVESLPASAFAGATERQVRLVLPNGLAVEAPGLQFLRDWAFPNFYFHVVTAYDILRNAGVEIGKFDYLALGDALRPAT